MARYFPCPYLNTDVELTDEREHYVRLKHELALREDGALIAAALEDPDEIRRSLTDATALLFYRWYDDLESGKYVAVVVVDDSSTAGRLWIVTAYVTDRPRRGMIEWKRS